MKSFLLSLLILLSIAVQAQVFTTSNLPLVQLYSLGNVIQQDSKIIGGITITNNANGLNHVSDLPNDIISLAAINIRGSTSAGFDQKSYTVELRDSIITNTSIKKSVLGMPSESDWILYGPYTDKTFMRNVLTYTIGSEMGEYAPRCKFVELTLDSVYQGVYVMMEKIKRDNNRVNVSKMSATDNTAPNVTGGYILKIDKFTGNFVWGFNTNITSFQGQATNVFFQLEYPKTLTGPQENYIYNYIDSFESALADSTFADNTIGYKKYINTKSFIHFFLSNELSNNVDGYRLSTYMYKKRTGNGDGKLHMGPLWDFNLGYVNADYCDGWRTDSWAYNQPCSQADIPFWWRRLLQDTAYANQLKCRYTYLRNTSMSNARINFLIDSMVNYVGASATARHYAKYPILGNYVWPNYYVGNTYAQEVDTLKSWITQRLSWMDANMPGIIPVGCLQAPLGILPISLKASAQGQQIVLSWQLLAEQTANNFIIERSKDAVHFESIGNTTAYTSGTENIFIDYTPFIGTNYYRLKYKDIENNYKETNIVSAKILEANQIVVYPTLAQEKINVQWNALKPQQIFTQIIDIDGRIMYSQVSALHIGQNDFSINTNMLPSGTYCIKFGYKQSNEITIKKFTKL